MQDPAMRAAAGAPAVVANERTLGLGGMSREGLLPAVLAVTGLYGGLGLLVFYGRHYIPWWRFFAAYLAGALCLVLSVWVTARLARRGDYPWLMFIATLALPLFQPQTKPDTIFWRLFGAAYGLVLVAIAVFALVRMISRTDELERRVNQEALAFAFASTVVLAIAYSLFRELLPELRGVWVAAGMIATWLVGWNVAWRRYR